jgi:hypothetical protein
MVIIINPFFALLSKKIKLKDAKDFGNMIYLTVKKRILIGCHEVHAYLPEVGKT